MRILKAIYQFFFSDKKESGKSHKTVIYQLEYYNGEVNKYPVFKKPFLTMTRATEKIDDNMIGYILLPNYEKGYYKLICLSIQTPESISLESKNFICNVQMEILKVIYFQ